MPVRRCTLYFSTIESNSFIIHIIQFEPGLLETTFSENEKTPYQVLIQVKGFDIFKPFASLLDYQPISVSISAGSCFLTDCHFLSEAGIYTFLQKVHFHSYLFHSMIWYNIRLYSPNSPEFEWSVLSGYKYSVQHVLALLSGT